MKRNRQGKIVALCNPEAAWSPRKTADVIRDIVQNKKSYYVQETPQRTYVRVVDGDKLQTAREATSANSLDKLASS